MSASRNAFPRMRQSEPARAARKRAKHGTFPPRHVFDGGTPGDYSLD